MSYHGLSSLSFATLLVAISLIYGILTVVFGLRIDVANPFAG